MRCDLMNACDKPQKLWQLVAMPISGYVANSGNATDKVSIQLQILYTANILL